MSSADWEDIWSSKVVGTEDETQGGVSILGTSLGNVFLTEDICRRTIRYSGRLMVCILLLDMAFLATEIIL